MIRFPGFKRKTIFPNQNSNSIQLSKCRKSKGFSIFISCFSVAGNGSYQLIPVNNEQDDDDMSPQQELLESVQLTDMLEVIILSSAGQYSGEAAMTLSGNQLRWTSHILPLVRPQTYLLQITYSRYLVKGHLNCSGNNEVHQSPHIPAVSHLTLFQYDFSVSNAFNIKH